MVFLIQTSIVVFLICVFANAVLGPVIYLFLDNVIHLFLRIKTVDKAYNYYVERTQHKIHKYVDKYGLIGVSLFIGVPLPGSGSYSGALGSYLLGIDMKRFIIANIVGVLIAGVLVTIISLTGDVLFSIFIKVL